MRELILKIDLSVHIIENAPIETYIFSSLKWQVCSNQRIDFHGYYPNMHTFTQYLHVCTHMHVWIYMYVYIHVNIPSIRFDLTVHSLTLTWDSQNNTSPTTLERWANYGSRVKSSPVFCVAKLRMVFRFLNGWK